MQIGVITNPNSRKNRNRPRWAEQLQEIVGDLGDVQQTDSVDGIKPILRDFLRQRSSYWVADGGDGALHWMLRMGIEVLAEPEFADHGGVLPLTMPTNGGTIDFVAKGAGVKGSADVLLEALRDTIEGGLPIDEVEVDSLRVDAVRLVDGREEPFTTYGFAAAAGGLGQRFFSKYYEHDDPRPVTILEIVAKTIASLPIAFTPLRHVPVLPAELREYSRDLFAPTRAEVTIDGEVLPYTEYTGLQIAAMAIDLGGVVRAFGEAKRLGVLHVTAGSPSPLAVVRNLPRMYLGKPIRDRKLLDGPCTEMKVRATGDELLAPVIDGEYYHDVLEATFTLGPRVRIPKVTFGQGR